MTSLIVIGALAVSLHLVPYRDVDGELGPRQIFSGFGHEALVATCCLLVLGRALMVTDALEPVALAILAVAMLLSAFINDTPVVVVLMPVAIASLLGVITQLATGGAELLAAVMAFVELLTNFVSNNVAAAIGTPVALSIAQQLGAPPEAFVLAAIVGCNLSFATPMSYQTNVLIMQPGGHVFRDFVRVCGPLPLLMIIAFSSALARASPA